MTKLIVALDSPSWVFAESVIDLLKGMDILFKFGSEFCSVPGNLAYIPPGSVIDLKLWDIPSVIKQTVFNLCSLKPKILTLNASGGKAMIEAAVEGVQRYRDEILKEWDGDGPLVDSTPLLLGVGVLTSQQVDERGQLSEIGVYTTPRLQLVRLTAVCLNAGANGMVCSGHELETLRHQFGSEPVFMCPSIRMLGDDTHDQQRIVSPETAKQLGADYIVMGRTIMNSFVPRAEVGKILRRLD